MKDGMLRDSFLVLHEGLHPALQKGLEAQGVRLVHATSRALPEESGLKRCLAALVWFYDLPRHPQRIWRLKRVLNRHGVPLMAWNRDAPHYLDWTLPRRVWRLNLANRLKLLDLYATHTLIDAGRPFADSVLYLPNAADTASYNLGAQPEALLSRLRDPGHYQWQVSFFGGMNGARYKEDRAREDFFSALSQRLHLVGVRHCFREAAGMTVQEQMAFIRGSQINLNFGARCEYGAAQASGLPERCYGIPASGGLLLCDRRTHARDDFSPGENWEEFSGLDDCVSSIQRLLLDFPQSRALAERCTERVLTRHTYDHRARRLLAALRDWHAGARGLL